MPRWRYEKNRLYKAVYSSLLLLGSSSDIDLKPREGLTSNLMAANRLCDEQWHCWLPITEMTGMRGRSLAIAVRLSALQFLRCSRNELMLLVCLSDKLYSFMFAVKAVARTPSPRKLEGNMPEGFPRMVTIQQAFPSGAALDIQANLHAQLAEKLGSRVKPGARIGVAVGSRGITNLLEIVLAAIDWLKERGTRPFIIPAMGSHALNVSSSCTDCDASNSCSGR